MKVNYSGKNRNEEFLKNYPKVSAYPHLFVLDSDGTFLHSQGTGELEEGRGYNEEVFLGFLNKWKPGEEEEGQKEQPAGESTTADDTDAEKLLAAALKRAGAEEKLVLVHLAAPS